MDTEIIDPGSEEGATPTGGDALRVVAVDGHPLTLHGVRAVIAGRDDIVVAGTAGTLADGRRLLEDTGCDVLIAELELPDGSGLDLIDASGEESATSRTIVLVERPTQEGLVAALERGAWGLLSRSVSARPLVQAILAVARGGVALEPGLVDPRPEAVGASLAPRQAQIVGLVARGRSNDEIAAALGISAKTVETHLSRLYQRFELQGRIELLRHAVARGWVQPIEIDATAETPGL